jgi:molecular chaperone DnaJ
MASRKDYYDILGIRRGATEEEIERAYRKLTRTYQFDPHLSNHKTAESRFKEISEAYEILSNKEKREKYDRSGNEIPYSDFDWEYDLEEGEEKDLSFEGFEDIFERYFGAEEQAALRKPQKGKDLYSIVEIRFEEAIQGTVKEVQVLRDISCSRCSGKRVDLTGPQKVCDVCGGAGQVQVGLPPSAFSQTCSRCHGEGKVYIRLCGSCSGSGRVTQKEIVGLQIPPGVDDRCCIYLNGKGQPGKNGGPGGDLVVDVRVQKHRYFQRKGDDLHMEVPLAVWEAALGAEVEVPTLDGSAILTIPQGLKNGEHLRLGGKGVPYFYGGGRGDQVISFKIVLPQNLDERSKEILEELKRLNPKDPRGKCR